MSEKFRLRQQKITGSSDNKSALVAAKIDPIASVLVDTPVSHLEGLYDYLVPEHLSVAAVEGTKVLIEFGNRKTEGLIIVRKRSDSNFLKMKPILGVSSPSGFIKPAVLKHIEVVRDRFGGSFWNLIKQAVPLRVMKEEVTFDNFEPNSSDFSASHDIQELLGKSIISKLANKQRIRWAITTPISFDSIKFVAEIALVRASCSQVLLLVPDEKDLKYFREEIEILSKDVLIEYGSHLPKNLRYRNYLRILNGNLSLILATRSGAFLPLDKDATVIVYSDLDKSHYELHSPGWNSRDVSLLRSSENSLLYISPSHSLEIERLISIGWLEGINFKRNISHTYVTSDGSNSFIPQIRKAISKGNVLVSVAEKGYANLFLCTKCRNSARCDCGGKLRISLEKKIPQCYLCSKLFAEWQCSYCGDKRPYVISKGIDRTAEEIGKAFNKVSILISSGNKQIESMPTGRHIVLATAGSEPSGEFSAVILLDGERIFNRPTLRSEELARHLWCNLIGKSSIDAEIFLSLPSNHPLVQSILRKDSSILANKQLTERKNSKMPPYFRIASVEGNSSQISKFADNLKVDSKYEIIGPIFINRDTHRLIIRTPIELGGELVDLLDDVVKIQSVKGKDIFNVRFDQFDI